MPATRHIGVNVRSRNNPVSIATVDMNQILSTCNYLRILKRESVIVIKQEP